MKYLLALVASGAFAMPAKPPKEVRPPVVSAPVSGLKSLFPKQAWTDHALKAVMESKLPSFSPKDAKSFCPKGMNARNWVHLLASMAKYESGFNPNLEFKESGNIAGVISTGLLQISLVSGNAYGCGFRSQSDIKDPLKNISCGIKIFEKWVAQDGVVTSGVKPYKSGGRYWSVLRSSGKLSSVKATLKPLCE